MKRVGVRRYLGARLVSGDRERRSLTRWGHNRSSNAVTVLKPNRGMDKWERRSRIKHTGDPQDSVEGAEVEG